MAIAECQRIERTSLSLILYTDGSGIRGRIGAAAYCERLDDQKAVCLGDEAHFTVYSGELYAIILALQMVRSSDTIAPITIFTDNQAAILSIAKGSTASGQYLLEEIIDLCKEMLNPVQVHWIPGHMGVEGNERADHLAKAAVTQPPAPGLKHLSSALRQKIKRKLADEHEAEWPQAKFGRKYHAIQPEITEKTLTKFKHLKRWEASIIVQLRTAHIGLSKYLHWRKVPGFPTPMCVCNIAQEEPYHVLFHCPLYQEIRDQHLWKDTTRSMDMALTTSDLTRCRNAARFMVETKRLTSFAWVSHGTAEA